MSEAIIQQFNPSDGKGDMWLEVMEDMKNRREFGISKDGKPVQRNNGRDALIDLYQELLDALVYCKQMIMERNNELEKDKKLVELFLREISWGHWSHDERSVLKKCLKWFKESR